jgi:uncharacterized membrane protein
MKASYYHAIALCAYLSLFSLLMLWNTVLSPPEKLPVALLLIITVTPLLLVLRGFLKGNLKSCSWMAYISMPYFIHGSIEAYARFSHLGLNFVEYGLHDLHRRAFRQSLLNLCLPLTCLSLVTN